MSNDVKRYSDLEIAAYTRFRVAIKGQLIDTREYVLAADYDAAQARIRELEARESTWAMRHERETSLTDKHCERITQLEAALAAEKDNAARGWELFQTFHRKYAELKYPGMTGEIKLKAGEQP